MTGEELVVEHADRANAPADYPKQAHTRSIDRSAMRAYRPVERTGVFDFPILHAENRDWCPRQRASNAPRQTTLEYRDAWRIGFVPGSHDQRCAVADAGWRDHLRA